MNVNGKDYGFDDLIASEFCYNEDQKKIKILFKDGYYKKNNKIIECPYKLTISSWKKAKSKKHRDEKFKNLNNYLGIISMILDMKKDGDKLYVVSNTISGDYIELFFDGAQIDITDIESFR